MAQEKHRELRDLCKSAGKPTNQQKQEFRRTWGRYVAEDGLSRELLQILADGQRFEPQPALVEFLAAPERTPADLERFFAFIDEARVGQEQRGPFALFLGYLAALLNEGKSRETVAGCAAHADRARAGGSFSGDEATIRKHFILALRPGADLSALRDDRCASLLNILGPALPAALSSKKLSQARRKTVEELLTLCPSGFRTVPGGADETVAASKNGAEEKRGTDSSSPETGREAGKGADKRPQAGKKNRPVVSDGDVPELLRSAAASYEVMAETARNAERALRDSTRENEGLKRAKTAQQAKIDELRFRIEQLEAEEARLSQALSEQRELTKTKEEELEGTQQLVETVRLDLSGDADARIQKISAALRHEYKDYEDGKDLDMSVDLGENMRDQLRRVFSTLEANGFSFA